MMLSTLLFLIFVFFLFAIGYLNRSKNDSKIHINYIVDGEKYESDVPVNKLSGWLLSHKKGNIINRDLSKIVDTIIKYQNQHDSPVNTLDIKNLSAADFSIFTAYGQDKKDRNKMLAIENQLSDALKKNSKKKYALNKNIGKLKDNISKDFNKKYGKKHIGRDNLDISQKSKLLETDKYDKLSRKELSKKAKEVKKLASKELNDNNKDINYENLQKLIDAQELLTSEDESKVYDIMDDAKDSLTVDDLIKKTPKNEILKEYAKNSDDFKAEYNSKTKELLDLETQKDIDPEQLKEAKYQDHLKAVYNLVKDDNAQKNKLQGKLTGALAEKIVKTEKIKGLISDAKKDGWENTKDFRAYKIKTAEEYEEKLQNIVDRLNNSINDIDGNIVNEFKDSLNYAGEYGIDKSKIMELLEKEAETADILSRDRLFLVYKKLKDDPGIKSHNNINTLFKTVLEKIEEADRQYISNRVDDIFNNIDKTLEGQSGSISIKSAIFSPLLLEETADIFDHVVNKSLLDNFSRYIGESYQNGDEVSVAAMKGWLKNDGNKKKLVNAVQSYVRSIVDKSIKETGLAEGILSEEELTSETDEKIGEAVNDINNGVKLDYDTVNIKDLKKQIKQSQKIPEKR